MATLLRPDGTTEEVQPANGVSWRLDELQGFVGGYIEIARPRSPLATPGFVLVVNEEGLLKHLPANAEASLLYGAGIIVGNALYCDEREID